MKNSRDTRRFETNLGRTPIKRRRGAGDPMREFDQLPEPLRAWLRQASLPWSPRSCRRLWSQYRKAGLSTEETLGRLSAAESRLLTK